MDNFSKEGAGKQPESVGAGRICADAGYVIHVADERFQFQAVRLSDPVVTGAQILAASRVAHPLDHLLFQMLPSGLLEEIRPEESTTLRPVGGEKFLVFRSDRSFRFQLDDRAFDWGATHISGATLKQLAGLEIPEFDVWLDTVGGKDRVIGDIEFADLTEQGVERFVTKPISITIIVNAKPRVVNRRRLAYWDVVLLAFPDAVPSEGIIYTIDYARGPHANPEGTLASGQHVQVKEGMKFYVTPTDKS